MPFQTTVNIQPAPGQEGDFASANPRASALAGPGAFVAGAAGLTAGRFVWRDPVNANQLNNFGAGKPVGFLHREFTALITNFLAEYGGLIQPGMEATAFKAGDFWAKQYGGISAAVGMKVYANVLTGAPSAAASGAPTQGATFTGVISAGVLTASVVTGVITPGQPITGTGVDIPTYIGAQLTGTPGGAGTYSVIGDQTAASTAMISYTTIETKWEVQSACLTLELFKMSNVSEG